MPTQRSIIRINLTDDDVAFRKKCNDNFLALQDFTHQLSLSDVDNEIKSVTDPLAKALREEMTLYEENFTREIENLNERFDNLDIDLFDIAYPVGSTILTYAPQDSETEDPRLNTGTWQWIQFDEDVFPEGCSVWKRVE